MCVEGVEEVFLDPDFFFLWSGTKVAKMGPGVVSCVTYFLSWPAATSWALSCDLRSLSIVAGV